MASPVSTKRVYTVKYLRTFKDLPECQKPPANANFPIVLRRVEKKNQRKTAQRTPRSKVAPKTRPAGWEQDEEEEILFVPPTNSTVKPSPKNAEKPKKEKQSANEPHYPGRRKLDKIGVDTQGKTPAELFELERQQARAKFQKNKPADSPDSPSPITSSSIPTKLSDEPAIPMEPISITSLSSIEQKMVSNNALSNEEDLLAKFKQINVTPDSDVIIQSPYSSPFQADLHVPIPFSSDFSEPFSPFEVNGRSVNHSAHPPDLVSDVDSLFRSTGPSTDSFLPFSSPSPFIGNTTHAHVPRRVEKAPEFSLAGPALPSQPQSPALTPFPSTEKLATANEIGNNLLRLLEQGMKSQPEPNAPLPSSTPTTPNQPPMQQQSFQGMPFHRMHPPQMHQPPNMPHRGAPVPFPPFNNQRPPMNFYPQQGGPQQGGPQQGGPQQGGPQQGPHHGNDQQQLDNFSSGGFPVRGGMHQYRGGVGMPQRGGMHQMPPGMNFPMPGGMKQAPTGYQNHYGNVRGPPGNQMFAPQHAQPPTHNMAPHSISSVEGFFNFKQEATSFAPTPKGQNILSLQEIEQRNQPAQFGAFQS